MAGRVREAGGVALDVRAVQRRTLTVVVAAQVLGGAGLAAGVTVGALLARSLVGGDGSAGLPIAASTLGSAGTAFVIGRVTQRRGRRPGLAAGFLAAAAGAAVVVAAAAIGSIGLLLAGLVVYGAGSATNLQARYAGTDLAPPERRGSAASIALVSTTLGAVAGPNLVTPTGAVAVALGLPPLVGPFVLAGLAYLAAGFTLLALLRPDPFLLARRLHEEGAPAAPAASSRARVGSGVVVGATVMLAGQVAMTAIMTMTPVHLAMHGHGLDAIGLVIGLHIAAMYLPSLLTGALVDRVGRVPLAVASGAVLLAAGIAAAVLGGSVAASVVALVLLGLGWNLGLIAGTAMIVDATTQADRARVQAGVDVLYALAGAGGGAASGAIVAMTDYGTLSLLGGALAIALVPVTVLGAARARRSPAA